MLEKLQLKLKQNGYKLTPQRKAILNVLIKFKCNLISVEKILKEVNTFYDKMNLSTIYRNLEILEKINLVHRIVNNDGLSLYKLNVLDKHHHHLICKKCGKTDTLNFCPIDYFEKESEKKSFKITEHKLELYGYCKDCVKY